MNIVARMQTRGFASRSRWIFWLGTWSALLAILSSAPPVSAEKAQPVAVFQLFVPNARFGAERGYGFVVQNWREDKNDKPFLLITTMHLLYRANEIIVRFSPADIESPSQRANPPTITSFGDGTVVLLWPTYDLAAIPFGSYEDIAKAMKSKGRSAASLADVKDAVKPAFVFAVPRGSKPESPIETLGNVVSIETHAKAVEANSSSRRSAREVQGDLASDANLIVYRIKSVHGMSGAPITQGRQTVFGVHLAGLDPDYADARGIEEGTGWAIAAGPILGIPPVVAAVNDSKSWPDFKPPDIRQGDEDYYADKLREELLKEARTRVVFGPAGSFGASPNGDYRAGAGFQLGYDEVEFHGLRPTQVGFSLGAMYRYGHSDLVTSINRTLPGETHGFELVPTGVFFWLGNSVAGVRFQFLPTAFGYSLATAENDEKFHLLTLRTGGGPRLDLNAGPVKFTLSGEVAAECGLDLTAGDCLVPWKFVGGSTLSMEFVVRDWDPWLIDPLGENDRRPPPSNSKLEAE